MTCQPPGAPRVPQPRGALVSGAAVLELTIDAPIPEISAWLTDVHRRQLPFATSLALNWTLGDARDQLIDELPRRFTLRNTFLERGIRLRNASKRRLEGRVYTVDDILRVQIEGGVKTGHGHAIALPRGVRRNAKGIIRRANRPRSLRRKPRHFVQKIRGGDRGIYRRRTKKRYPIEFLWRLHEGSVRIDSRFDFVGIVRRTVRRRWPRNFGRALARAIATARRP